MDNMLIHIKKVYF